jgi:hypothetical protein
MADSPHRDCRDDIDCQIDASLYTKRSANDDISSRDISPSPQDGARRLPRGLRHQKSDVSQRAWAQAGRAATGVCASLLELRQSVDDPKTLDQVAEAFAALNAGLQAGTLGPLEFNSHFCRMRDVKDRLEKTFSTDRSPRPTPRGEAWTPKRVLSYRKQSGPVAERVSEAREANAPR